MALRNTTDNAKTTLSGAITNSQTTLSVATGEGSKFPTGNFIFVVYDADGSNYEKILCATRSTDSMTSLIRGYGGTTAVAHANGSIVELPITSDMIADIDNELFRKFTLKENITGQLPVKLINDSGTAKIEKLLGSQYKAAGTEITIPKIPLMVSFQNNQVTAPLNFKVLNEFYGFGIIEKFNGTFRSSYLASIDMICGRIIDSVLIYAGEPTSISNRNAIFGISNISGSGKDITCAINLVYSFNNKGLRGIKFSAITYGMLQGAYAVQTNDTTTGDYNLMDMDEIVFTYSLSGTNYIRTFSNGSFGTAFSGITGSGDLWGWFGMGYYRIVGDLNNSTVKLLDSGLNILKTNFSLVPSDSAITLVTGCSRKLTSDASFRVVYIDTSGNLKMTSYGWDGTNVVEDYLYSRRTILSGITGGLSPLIFSDGTNFCIIFSSDGTNAKLIIIDNLGTILSPIYTLPFTWTNSMRFLGSNSAAYWRLAKQYFAFLNSRKVIYTPTTLSTSPSIIYCTPDDRDEFLGIIQATATAGNTQVVRMEGSISSGHTGLTFPADYYLQADGTLGTTITPYKIGKAISATEIKL